MQTLSAFETHTWCSEMEDYIGTESCVDLQQHTDVSSVEVDDGRQRRSSDSDRRLAAARRREKKEYPPPIPSPWVMKRYYTDDGRLVIREENVGRHEYFEVHRANGRLTLQLVDPRNDNVEGREEDCYDDDVEYFSDLDGEGCDDPDGAGTDDDVECDEDGIVDVCDDESDEISEDREAERMVEAEEVRVTTVVVGGGGGKCYSNKYSSGIGSPCLFGMPVVPAIRAVHI